MTDDRGFDDQAQPAAPAGWYPDPDGGGGQRYYDGSVWTDHRTPPAGTPGPGGQVIVQSRTSGMAIASLVLGIVWIWGIGSILAVIFSLVAKKNIRESNGLQTGSGMATAGLVLGIVGIVGAAAVIVIGLTADDVNYDYTFDLIRAW